jgi:hypothetical protein
MEERLMEVLRGLGYTDDEIHLEPSGGGKVGGYIISKRSEARARSTARTSSGRSFTHR